MSQVIDLIGRLLPARDQITVIGQKKTEKGVLVKIKTRRRGKPPPCPSCSRRGSYHSTYSRHLQDLPWQGQRVSIEALVRRFRCLNRICPRKIFGEQLPFDLALPRRRETRRLSQMIVRVGYTLGGLPGSRLLASLGVKVSDDTVLRRLKGRDLVAAQTKVLAVDEWAWRKHQHCGTILVDLESRNVVDLLSVRSAESFSNWLGEHPGVEVIVRDRDGLFADGGRQGAPGAVQVADRYHLVHNLSEAVESDVQRLQVEARSGLERGGQLKEGPWRRRRRLRCREARYQRYLNVVELRRQGCTQVQIGDEVGLNPNTVAIWLAAVGFPERRIRRDRTRDRARLLQAPGLRSTHFSTGRVAALLSTPPPALRPSQVTYLERFFEFCPSAHRLRSLVMSFKAMLRHRRSELLPVWIEKATSSQFPFVAQYARGLRRAGDVVALAVSTPWSTGPAEGHINRLKVIKRQMYGRAGFDLLKARVVPLEPAV